MVISKSAAECRKIVERQDTDLEDLLKESYYQNAAYDLQLYLLNKLYERASDQISKTIHEIATIENKICCENYLKQHCKKHCKKGAP